MSHSRTFRTLALAVAGALSMTAHAVADTPKTVNVVAGNLADALETLAKQCGVDVIYPSSQLKGLTTAGVSGVLETRAAFQELLKGTQLVMKEEGGSVLITLPTKANTAEVRSEQNVAVMRLTQTDNPQNTNSSDSSSESEKESEKQKEDTSSSDEGNSKVEEVVVTGTHIRGTADLPMPVITFTRADIEKTGYSRVEELFKSLPQNLADVGPTVGEGASRLATDNIDRATAINLRGLGPQSTLVLLNGQRRAGSVQGRVVDVSAIPLSVIERVEVVTGGRSAIYGSDAVAGVVNLVTRRDFEGAESSAYYAAADAGAERFQASHIYGNSYQRGGFVAAYDYSESSSLDATEAGVVRLPTAFGIVPTPGAYDLLPDDTRHSAFVSGRYSVTDNVEVYADGLYTTDTHENVIGYSFPGSDFWQRAKVESDQYSFSPGIRLQLSDLWTLGISGVHGRVETDVVYADSTSASSRSKTAADLSSLSAVLDGSLVSTSSVEVKTAVGVEGRREYVESASFSLDSDRTVRSVFAEALVSLWPSATGEHRVQLSLAGRYSDYSDFGSSTDPQFGVSWNPAAGLTLRGSYSTAFRAPDLYSLNDTYATQATLIDQSDPTQAGAPVPTLIWTGNNSALSPEEAKTWSVGFDYTPSFAPAATLSLSYFDIEYDQRIDQPANDFDEFDALTNEQRYPGFIDRTPNSALLEAIVDRALAQGGLGNPANLPYDPDTQTLLEAFPNLILFDNRAHNVSIQTMRGMDLALSNTVEAAFGTLSFGLNGVYYMELERRLTAYSPIFSELNGPSKLVDFKLRGNAGWTRSALGVFLYVNYVDGYTDTIAVPTRKIDSWTTVDATLRFDGSKAVQRGWLHGLTATLGVANLFDEEPPVFLSNTFGVGYDPANASPIGRFISLGVVKKW